MLEVECNSLCIYVVPNLHKPTSYVIGQLYCLDTTQAVLHLIKWTLPFSLQAYVHQIDTL